MGKNKLKKFSENLTFRCLIQPQFEEVFRRDHPLKGRWRSEFFGNDRPIVLELGCGRGEYTVGLAEADPATNYIGVDIKGARMWRGAKTATENRMANVAFLRTRIEFIDSFFAPGEVAEIWITFPDPQMKKVRKRLTSTRFMELYRKVLRPGGIINLKTDSPFLYTYTREMVALNTLPLLSGSADLYAEAGLQGPLTEIRTHYERQWLDRGLTIKYLSFVLPAEGNLAEPEIEIEHDTYRSYSRGYIECPQLLTETHKNDETRTISGADN